MKGDFMNFLQKHWRTVSTLTLLAALGVLGGFEVRRALSDDCCQPGASCCHPGAACCHHGSNAQASR